MKKNFVLGFLIILIAVASCSFTNKSFETNDKDKLLLDLITYVLERGHYEPKDINDKFSANVYEDFIDILDPTKRYFIESDIREFEQYKYQIDDQIKNTEISFFNLVYQRLMKRMDEAKDIYTEVLEKPFDFNIDEEIVVDYKEEPYAANKKQLKERWRKQLKYNALGVYDGKIKIKNTSSSKGGAEGGDLASVDVATAEEKADEELKNMTLTEVEAVSRETTKNTLDDFFEFVSGLERKDWFEQYVNTIVDEFDPHTYYFGPEEKDKFDISMSGKFVGIGARLQKKPEGAKIVEIISGGPVWRAKSLEVGDEILKVGQDGEESIDIVGMRLDDAIKLIKGPKGTIVDLTVRKVDGTVDIV